MSKANRFDVTVPLLWEEDDALERAAKLHKVPKAGAMRLGLYKLLGEVEPRTVKALIRLRIGCRVIIQKATTIFTPAPPKEMAEVFNAEVESLHVAIKNPESLGGAKVAADAISEFLPGGTFEDHRKETK